MFYKDKSAEVVTEGKWDEKSCVRRIGGYDVDKTNLPTDYKWLPKGAVLSLSSDGKAVLVKSAKVYENASASATSVKVEQGHALIVGDKIGGATISAITAGDGYDTLTISALSAKVSKGDVLTDASSSTTILGLCYATVFMDDAPTCTATLQAYEIEEDTLPYPIDSTIKEALTARHAFKL